MSTHQTFPGTASFLILHALSTGPASGSAIFDRIVAIVMVSHVKRSTLYSELGHLTGRGLIELASAQGREKIFRLTTKGEITLARELQLLETILASAPFPLPPRQPATPSSY
jgi:DNA-binding PadR family transcriptional regulator